MEKIVKVNHLSVNFQAKERAITVVDNVHFTLIPGETVALLGESGCGKSLTSLAIMRLLPPGAMYGMSSEVNLAAEDLLNLPERIMQTIRGRRLAMIFQEPMTALNPVLSIGQQLGEAIRQHQNLSHTHLQERMIHLLKEVEIPLPEVRLRQYPHQLSGGQKQRVVIAMALACKPDVLIADEPTTALDVTTQAQILALLKKLQRQYQMSLLLITHDLGVVKAMAHQVCVMYAGQIVEMAMVSEFFTQPLHPYSQQLLNSTPTFSKRGQVLQAISGQVPTFTAMPSGCRFHPRCAHIFEPCSAKIPLLQTVQNNREVRCHLYPQHHQPPTLPNVRHAWEMTKNNQNVLLSVQNLGVYFSVRHNRWPYRKEVHRAVDNLSFSIKKGKTLALVGESGCGKTTTARALLRLQPITTGTIEYDGQNILLLRGRALRQFRKKIQIIFQDPFSSMNPRMTVGEILAEGMQAQGFNPKYIVKRQKELLEQVQLSLQSLHRYPHQFSGGQRQRICIARALATKPELLVCDEPTSALDISVQAQILNLLKELQQEYELSYLFITHNMAVVSYLADEVLVMRAGIAVEYGKCEQVLQHPAHEYTQALLGSVLEV